MKPIHILYWVFTVLLVAMFCSGAYFDITKHPEAVKTFNHLGYPIYLLPFIGVAKILGGIALLVPGFPRLKEWAYAGFVIDITGALYSHLSVGDPVSGLIPLFIGYVLIAASYILWRKKQVTKLAVVK